MTGSPVMATFIFKTSGEYMVLKSNFPLLTKKIPMKNKLLFLVVVSFTILCLTPQHSFAQLFGDEEKKWERVLMEMKKVNSRLVSLKTKDVESLHSTQSKLQATQGEVLSQIQALQTLLPNIQGVVEQSNSELGRKVSEVSAKLSDMEIYLKDELEKQNAGQAESSRQLSADLNSKVDAMSASMTAKVDVMSSNLTTQVDALRSEVGAQVNTMGETVGSRVDAIGKETSGYVDAMKNEMSTQVSTMRTETAARLGDLKSAMALDVEKINQILAIDMDKINQNLTADRQKINQNMDLGLERINQNISKNMEKIDQNNSGSLVGVKTMLSTQNNLMSAQDKKIGEAITLLAELTKVDEGASQQTAQRQEAMLTTHREAVFAKINEMDAGTKTMIDILSKGLEENQSVGVGVKDLNSGLAALNENITINRAAISKFKSIFDTNITNLVKSQGDIQTQNEKVVKNANLLNQNLHVAETKINKLAETIKTLYAQSAANAKSVASMQDQVSQITGIIGQTDKKFDTLIETTKLVLSHSQMMEQKLDDVVLKVDGASSSIPETGIADEKYAQLVDILKTIASKQDNVIQGVTAHEVSMTQILNVHESNVKQALNVYDNNIAGALKAYSQSLTEYEGNLIQAWNVHDKNTTLGQADQALLVESFKTAQEEIQNVLIELNKNTAEVNRSTNSLNMNTTELGRKTADIGKKTAEIGRITSELMRSSSSLAKSSASNGASQEEIKNTINDLRKKANVNISRNDDILKSLKKLQLQ
jgi:chromosome segregation ATPase